MARIDNDGLQQVIANVRNPIKVIADKLESRGLIGDFVEDINFILKFVDKVESEWSHNDDEAKPNVTIDGKVYQPIGE